MQRLTVEEFIVLSPSTFYNLLSFYINFCPSPPPPDISKQPLPMIQQFYRDHFQRMYGALTLHYQRLVSR